MTIPRETSVEAGGFGLATSPRITIVTPSFNQGPFLEATIQSVLRQEYPNFEYIIIDGGSTDGSIEIIRRHEKHLKYWVSEKDNGQTQAINKGFAKSTGQIMAWLNSDDLYCPGALKRIAETFARHPNIEMITGGWLSYTSSTGQIIPVRPCGVGLQPTPARMLRRNAYLGQHSTFWRRGLWDRVGPLNESLHFAMDHEFFLRCVLAGAQVRLDSQMLAIFRQHAGQKTSQWDRYQAESAAAKQPFLTPYWKSPVGKTLMRLSFWMETLARHRNVHPRLGLSPQYDRIAVSEWLLKLGER